MIGWTLRILAIVRGLVGHVGGSVAGALLVVPLGGKQVPLFDGDVRR
jgi:hypothetical protein